MKKLISLLILLCSLTAMGQTTTTPVKDMKVTIKQVTGSFTQTNLTGKDGVAKFNNLAAGDYSITYEQLTKTEGLNESTSNQRPTTTRDGKTVIFVTITLVKVAGPKKPQQTIVVTIGSNGGSCEVVVKEEVAVKEEGVKG